MGTIGTQRTTKQCEIGWTYLWLSNSREESRCPVALVLQKGYPICGVPGTVCPMAWDTGGHKGCG